VRAFVAVQTQWRHGPSSHLTGLDYAGCRAAVAALGFNWRDVFEGLRIMESEMLGVATVAAGINAGSVVAAQEVPHGSQKPDDAA